MSSAWAPPNGRAEAALTFAVAKSRTERGRRKKKVLSFTTCWHCVLKYYKYYACSSRKIVIGTANAQQTSGHAARLAYCCPNGPAITLWVLCAAFCGHNISDLRRYTCTMLGAHRMRGRSTRHAPPHRFASETSAAPADTRRSDNTQV